jgi:hypothetical protein
MWTMIGSLEPIVAVLQPAFTQPSFASSCHLLLAWVMCLGKHTLRRVGETAHPDNPPDHAQRHGLVAYYNFFERSAWAPRELAHRVGVLLLTRLKFFGVRPRKRCGRRTRSFSRLFRLVRLQANRAKTLAKTAALGMCGLCRASVNLRNCWKGPTTMRIFRPATARPIRGWRPGGRRPGHRGRLRPHAPGQPRQRTAATGGAGRRGGSPGDAAREGKWWCPG